MNGDELFKEFMRMPDSEKEAFAKHVSLLNKRDRDRWLENERRANMETSRLMRRLMNDRTTE